MKCNKITYWTYDKFRDNPFEREQRQKHIDLMNREGWSIISVHWVSVLCITHWEKCK